MLQIYRYFFHIQLLPVTNEHQKLIKYKYLFPTDADGNLCQTPDAYACDRCRQHNLVCHGHREDRDQICVPCQTELIKRRDAKDETEKQDWRSDPCCTKAPGYAGTRIDWAAKGRSVLWDNVRTQRSAQSADSRTSGN